MKFKTLGNPGNPAVLFFHAMGVTGDSSLPVAKVLAEKYYCILPTSSVYCKGQKYVGKGDEVRQIKRFLEKEGTDRTGNAPGYGSLFISGDQKPVLVKRKNTEEDYVVRG